MKKILTMLLAVLMIVGMFAGCGKSAEPPKETSVGGPQTPGKLPKPQDASTPAETEAETTPETQLTESEDSYASLVSLRQAMVETPQLFAVAYFGYHDTIDSDAPVDPYAVMQEQAPQLCEDLPFLLNIPADRVIGNHGDLFCIVPLDEDAAVAVSLGTWNEAAGEYEYEESLYFSESGEPILLFCNHAGFEPDTQLYISGPSGDAIWYPMIDDNQCAAPLRNDDWEDLFLDFSAYREMLMEKHRDMKDSEWVMPTADMLAGTTWVWNGYRKDGLDASYRVTFQEGTLDVHWDDGLDEYTYDYPDASWELTYDEGFAVLSIDFREFAGILRYNLLYHEVYEQLYVAQDASQDPLPNLGWEPLYRFLQPSTVPEPIEMLGVWELAWTEVEGDRVEAEPQTDYITIFLNDDDAMRITMDNYANPNESFTNKELADYDGEMFSGCGNDQWFAYVGYMGPWDTIYSVTLLEDGMLLMELYWEVDGAPMVAHKWYRRTA